MSDFARMFRYANGNGFTDDRVISETKCMSSATLYPHLTPATDGSMHIGTTRYQAIHLAAEHYEFGWSAEELLRQHPDLRPEEVYSTLTWFYDRFDEIVKQIKWQSEQADLQRIPVSVSRDELLRRKAAGHA